MDKSKYIAFEGDKKTLEWYFDDRKNMPAYEYWLGLEKTRRNKVIDLFELMSIKGEIKNKEKFVHEGDGIYAFKTHKDRFFCFFFEGSKIIITNAYKKQGDKMPLREKHKALEYRESYWERVKAGKYYEQNKS